MALDQVELSEVVSQDGVLDGGEHEADVLGVCGAGEVGVDRLLPVWVLVLVHLQDELPGRFGIASRPWETKGGGCCDVCSCACSCFTFTLHVFI